MLELEGVRAGYGRTMVLDGVDLRVGPGDIVALLGRNGVGKTTTLRAIVGEIRLAGGHIRLGGAEVGRSPTHLRARSGIAYVPQGREIFPRLSVLDNLHVAGFAAGGDGWRERLDDLLDEFPVLAAKRRDAGGSLSGGQQQILALARALVADPSVLLLDEPSEGIQPSIVEQIAETVVGLGERRGIAVLLVEQNLDVAARMASRAYLMAKGRVVRELPPDQLLADRDLQHEFMGV